MSEELLLALLNSAPRIDGVRQDHLADDDGLRSWLAEYAPADLPTGDVRGVRSALHEVVRGKAEPTALAPFIEGVTSRPHMTSDGLKWTLDGDTVAARAILAWDELRATAPGRLRPCANAECELFLLDRSKANNARWCSMAVCGNRMKARRHYERVRGK